MCFFSICSFKNKPTATTKIHLLGTEWKLKAAGLGERSWRKLQKLGELIVQTGCATQPWGVSATFPEARSLCSEGKSSLFCDPPPVFCAFTTRIQRCQRVRFSSGKQAWEPPQSPRPLRVCTHRGEQRHPLPGWEIHGRKSTSKRPPPSAPGAASALTIPTEAGVHGCHTCNTAPTPPPPPTPAPPWRSAAASRPHRTERRAGGSWVSCSLRSDSTPRSPPAGALMVCAVGRQLSAAKSPSDSRRGAGERDPPGFQAFRIGRPMDVKLPIARLSENFHKQLIMVVLSSGSLLDPHSPSPN